MTLRMTDAMPRLAGPRLTAWAIGLAAVCCAALPARAQALIDAGGQANPVRQQSRGESAADHAARPKTRRERAGAAGNPPAAAPAKAPGGDRRCARMVTRHRQVASLSGGPMQMIMVTECVPG